MAWYYCDPNHAGKKCHLCGKPVKQDDPIYFTDVDKELDKNGLVLRFGVEHFACAYDEANRG